MLCSRRWWTRTKGPDKFTEAFGLIELHRTGIRATPHLGLQRGTIIPLKIQLLSLRMTIHGGMLNEERANLCLAKLEDLDKDRITA